MRILPILPTMPAFSSQTIAILAMIAFLTIVAMLRVLATAIHNETFVHDLRVRVFRLRLRHLALERAARDMVDPAMLPDDQDELIRFVRTGKLDALHGIGEQHESEPGTHDHSDTAAEPLPRAA